MILTRTAEITLPTLSSNIGNTFGYSMGPVCVENDVMTLRGHNLYGKFADVQLPTSGPATNVQWFDPTGGKLASLQTELANNKIYHRGIMVDGDRFWGFVQPFYNVSNMWFKSHYTSDGTACQAWGKTSIPSLKTAGFIGDLPQKMRDHFGLNTFCFESIPQGLAATNNGPALYLFNRSPSVPDNSTINLVPVIEHSFSAPYPGWWGDREINGACFTETHFVCGYRNTFGTRWYGNNSQGHLYEERNTTPKPNHPIASELYPGVLAIDPLNNATQGYHAELYAPFLLCCSIDSIIAGAPEWEEIDLRTHGLSGPRGMVAPTFDRVTGDLYVVEFRVDADKPKIHVFEVLTEIEMNELIALRAAVDALEAAITAKDAEITALNAQVAAKDTTIDILRVSSARTLEQLLESQTKVANALTALEQAE